MKFQKGFTLIELLLVVGLISLASISIYAIYNKIQLQNNTNNESRNIDLIRSGVKGLYAIKTSTTGLTNRIVNEGNITPKNMIDLGNVNIINHTLGGSINITPTTLLSGDDGFRISYDKVPSGACIKLITTTGNQFERLTVEGVVVKALGTNTVVDISLATTQCSLDTGTGVTIFFDSLK